MSRRRNGGGPLYAAVEEVEAGQASLAFDDGTRMVIPASLLPQGAKPSSVLRVRFELDEEEKKRRIEEVKELQRRLIERSRGKKK